MAMKPKKQMPANKGETGGGMPRGTSGSKGVTSSKLPPKLVNQLKADVKARQTAKSPDAAKTANAKKLTQLDRRSKSIAPGKKYSDMTPAEKRKWDSLNAETTNRMTKK